MSLSFVCISNLGGYFGFQVKGMIEGLIFLGFEIFNFGIFLGRKILVSIFLGSLI